MNLASFYGIVHLTNMLHLFHESYFVFGPNPLVWSCVIVLFEDGCHPLGGAGLKTHPRLGSFNPNKHETTPPSGKRLMMKCIPHLPSNEWNWMHCEKKKRLILDEEEMLQPECQLWKTAPRPVRSFPCNTATSYPPSIPLHCSRCSQLSNTAPEHKIAPWRT